MVKWCPSRASGCVDMTLRQRNWMLIFAVCVFIFVLSAVSKPERAQTSYFQTTHPAVIAHQGGDGLFPGNTMPAFEHANALGVDVLEMDVHQTRDGVLVLMHDASVERTTDGRGLVREMDADALFKLDAAYHWPFDGSSPWRGKGVVVPRLDAVLAAFPEQRFNIEIKQEDPPIGAALCESLKAHNATDRALIASFHRSAMLEFRQACPMVATSAHRYEVMAFVAFEAIGMITWHSPAAHALQVPLDQYGITLTSPERLEAAHLRDLYVDAWTLNDPEQIDAAFRRGIDGVITDRPDIALEVRNRIAGELSSRADP